MSHVNKGRRFGRFSQHRLALLKNLTKSVIEHEVIKTTLPKAKTLRGFVERLITLAKEDTQSRRRLIFSRIQDKKATQQLFDLGRRYSTRPGGYTRVLKCGFRQGDAAPMAYIELIPETE